MERGKEEFQSVGQTHTVGNTESDTLERKSDPENETEERIELAQKDTEKSPEPPKHQTSRSEHGQTRARSTTGAGMGLKRVLSTAEPEIDTVLAGAQRS